MQAGLVWGVKSPAHSCFSKKLHYMLGPVRDLGGLHSPAASCARSLPSRLQTAQLSGEGKPYALLRAFPRGNGKLYTIKPTRQLPTCRAFSVARLEDRAVDIPQGSVEYCVVNFYHLTDVDNPFEALEAHRRWLQGQDICGRIYISAQGINAQYSGTRDDAVAYAEWVQQQEGFQGLRFNVDPVDSHKFPKLRLKVKQNLVQLAGGTANLPLTDPEARARPLKPQEWRDMLRNAVAPSSSADKQHNAVVLDVRNSYEWDAGHFAGAQRPVEDEFRETPTDASPAGEVPGPLAAAPPDTPVLMYCTGGIRCDIYSAYLRRKGFHNLYTLEGGVQAYLKEQPGEAEGLWRGSLYVFDERMAIAPADAGQAEDEPLEAAVPCSCGQAGLLPHMNCANIDCNKLFIACASCREKLSGCCSTACMNPPRLLRPVRDGGHYRSWVEEAGDDVDAVKDAIALGRGEGRTERRRRHSEKLRQRWQKVRENAHERKLLAREAMEQRAAEKMLNNELSPTSDRLARLAQLRAKLQSQRENQAVSVGGA